jgi:hypothetical protein
MLDQKQRNLHNTEQFQFSRVMFAVSRVIGGICFLINLCAYLDYIGIQMDTFQNG